MTNIVDNGTRLQVAFDFYTGEAGLSRREGAAEGTVAVRQKIRGADEGSGTVGGLPVRVVQVRRSPAVAGMTLIDVVFLAPEPEQE